MIYDIIMIYDMWCVGRFGTICTIKKREKHPWTSVNFSKVAGFSRLQALGLKTTATELKTSHQHLSNEKKTECFFRFVQPL